MLSYALWAFQVSCHETVRPVLAVTVLLVLVALLRNLMLVNGASGGAERPDRALPAHRVVLGRAGC